MGCGRIRGVAMRGSDYDGEFDRELEKGWAIAKGRYGRVVVWPPEAATPGAEEPVEYSSLVEQQASLNGAGSIPFGKSGKIPFLAFNRGERQRARGDVWDIRARRVQDLQLAVLIWIVLALVEIKYGPFQFAWADFVSSAMGGGRKDSFGVVGVVILLICIVPLSLTNNGIVLDRRSGTAWFWFGLLWLKKAKAVPFERLKMNTRDNVEEGGAGGGRTVTLSGLGRPMRVFRGDDGQARAYIGRLEAFFNGRDVDFIHKGKPTARDILSWLVVSFCLLLALLLEYLD